MTRSLKRTINPKNGKFCKKIPKIGTLFYNEYICLVFSYDKR